MSACPHGRYPEVESCLICEADEERDRLRDVGRRLEQQLEAAHADRISLQRGLADAQTEVERLKDHWLTWMEEHGKQLSSILSEVKRLKRELEEANGSSGGAG